MKKFFSILCALAIVLGVNAAQVSKNDLVKKTAKKEIRTFGGVKKAPAKAVQFKGVKKTVDLQKATVASVAKAPQAKKEALEITISRAGFQNYGGGDLFYALFSDDGKYRFDFDILETNTEAEDVELGKTYTFADMDADYSYGRDLETEEYFEYAEASFTKTLGAEDQVVIEASVTDAEGQVYNLHYDAASLPEAPAGGTFAASEGTSHYYASTSDVQYVLTFKEEKLQFAFDIILAEGEDVESGKTYTLEEMDAEYSWGRFDGRVSIIFASASFTKTVAADGSYKIEAVVVDTLNNTWNLSFEKAAPVIRNQELKLNGVADPGKGYPILEAADADSTAVVHIELVADSLGGDFTEDDFFTFWGYSFSYVLFEEVEYDVQKAALHVDFDAAKNIYSVTGTLNTINPENDLDIVVFALDLTLEGPDPIIPKSEKTLTLSGVLNDLSGAWQLQALNEDETEYLTLAAISSEIAGEYSVSDLYASYSYVGLFQNGDTAWYDLEDGKITVAINGEQATITGDLVGVNDANAEDVILFHINVAATFKEDDGCSQYDAEEGNDFIVNFAEFEIDDQYLEQYGLLFISAQSAANEYISLELWLPEGATELVAGEYPVSAEEQVPQTVTAGLLDLNQGKIYGSFAGNLTAQGISTPLWLFIDGKVTVAENGTITVDVVNCAGAKIQCQLGGEQGIDNVDADKVATKSIKNGQLIIRKNGVDYNAQGAIVK